MKCGRQIYVIYFLFTDKMRQIVILFLTFSGICKGFAQAAADTFPKYAIEVPQAKKDTIAKEKTAIKIYPNPAKNKVELSVSGFQPGSVQLQILDQKGNKLRDDKRLLFSGNESITVMFSLPAGFYFIQVRQNNLLLRKKLMVQ